jgi:hypothetical protein
VTTARLDHGDCPGSPRRLACAASGTFFANTFETKKRPLMPVKNSVW